MAQVLQGVRVLEHVHIIASPDATLASALWCGHFLAEVERLRPAFILLDPLAELSGGEENSNTDQRPTVKFVRRLTTISGAAVAIVHHLGKPAEGKRDVDRIRGASAIQHASRVTYVLERV